MTTIAPSAEVNATAGIDAAIADGQIAKGASVGILTGNGPEHVAATAAAKTALEANNNKVTVVAVNTLGGDTGVTGTESAVGGICYTTFGDNVNSAGSLATETIFEKECRTHFDAMSTADFDCALSYPGVPSGETRTLPDGTKVSSDYAPVDCTFSNVIKLALEKAGKDLDRGSFMTAGRSLGDVPIALASNGKGNAAEDKTYLATLLHGVKLTAAPTGTAKNATGTYNGCAIDVQCWVPANATWYPISK